MSNKVQRIDWIDCAKGIGMFLVILGHTVSMGGNDMEQIIRGIIFSFHMPMFFILSCITFSFSENESQFIKKTERAFRHLVVPAVVLFALRVFVDIVQNFNVIKWRGYIAEKINILVYSSGVGVNIFGVTVPSLGMMWFLIALFVGRSLLDYLNIKIEKKGLVVTVFVCAVLGIAFGLIQWLPLSIDITLAAMPFFLFGVWFKKVDINNHRLFLIISSFVVWLISFSFVYFVFHDYLELAGRRYPLFPICYVTAVTGTVFISYLSRMIVDFPLARPVTYFGSISLWLFCAHAMDYLYSFAYNRTGNSVINGIIRICLDCIVAFFLNVLVSKVRECMNFKLVSLYGKE